MLLAKSSPARFNRMRRLKCDEAKPTCLRCATFRVQCGGYSWTTASTASLPQQPSALLGLCRDASPQDREIFFTLRTMVFNDISGAFDRNFWTVDAVRAAQAYPAVWHAGLAVTALQQSLARAKTTQGGSCHYRLRAMEQYGRAVRSIINTTRQTDLTLADKEAVLLSNVLLIGFCCLQDDTNAAMAHIGNSLQIFYRWRFWDGTTNCATRGTILNTGSLVGLFRRFELQFTMTWEPSAGQTWKIQEPSAWPSLSAFTSTMDAYAEFIPLDLAFRTGYSKVQGVGVVSHPNPAPLHTIRTLLITWKAKFNAFLQSRYVRPADEECVLTLQICSAAIEISLLLSLAGNATPLSYDAFYPAHKAITGQAERLYDVVIKNRETRQSLHIPQQFSFSMSVCDQLQRVGLCRDGAVRRRAIAVLRKWPYRDGMSNPAATAAMMEAVMLFEEQGLLLNEVSRPDGCLCVLPQYICEMHRVCGASLAHIREGEGEVRLLRKLDLEGELSGRELRKKMKIYW